jgi:hydrogenase maturation protease
LTLKTLIIGYGNIDRQDDGVAWHVLLDIMQRLGIESLDLEDEDLPLVWEDLEFQFDLQLLPEIAADLANYDRVVFIDAHTGNVAEEVHQETVSSQYQTSPFTHHLTPATLLSLCDVIHKKHPDALLVSVRGYEFQFTRALSQKTMQLVPVAGKRIVDWLK